jgi:GNAT superfamily N-acetyltransferase/uncharacterized glyoxalase superfamily protein PhnB
MNNPSDSEQPVFSHAEPVLAVRDVARTIRYWQDVLGFPTQWVWGEPPTIGAVSWQGAHVQFLKNDTLANASVGNSVWMRLRYIDQLYKLHQERGADIVEPLQRQPWGMDQYVVKDMNGYYLCFAGNSGERHPSREFPSTVKIVERKPTGEEFLALSRSVGWGDDYSDERILNHLTAPAYGAVAIDEHSNKAIACVLLMTDHSSFYYVKDLIVHPDWQKRRIGTALMNTLMRWLDQHAIANGLVGLYTGENLERFYRQFGFGPAFGMIRRM